jgi:hypothetical protein
MIKQPTKREAEMFNKLAATGKYVNTGKVLIGVAYTPPLREMHPEETHIQKALLRKQKPGAAK